ncbi:MAG: LicD family protein [Thermoguttaceae bacterium]|nr:LicD family protein [Thermoguttaceae bacterium]
MATIREIQLTELKMLGFLDEVCRKYDLKYFLVAGTMLGAVRHRGFIPWDDDIDVYMPLNDFKKLKQVFFSQQYFLQTPETDIQMPFVIYKMRKNGSRMVEPGTEKLEIHQGIWIDIITYVNAGNGALSRRLQHNMRRVLQTYRCRYRYVEKSSRRYLHYFFTRLSPCIQLKIDHLLENLIVLFGSKQSKDCFIMSVDNAMFMPKRFLDKLSTYEFEGKSFFGIKEYDDYLKMCYGENYMIPKQWNHLGDYSNVEL